jgi:uncharacterized protein (TIGR03435 family)
LALPTYKGNTFTFPDASLASLIRWAYGIGRNSARPFATVEGEPSWSRDRYTIVAKTSSPVALTPSTTIGPLNLMLQSLLVDRFGLSVRWVTRDQPVQLLTLVESDGRLGPQLRRSTVDCEAYLAETKAAIEAGTFKRPVLGAPRERPVCGVDSGPKIQGVSSVPGTREVLMGARPIAMLAEELGRQLDRPVLDRTGLEGNYDIELRFAVERLPAVSRDTAEPPVEWPALPTALREQLGLKVESGRGAVEALVVDSVRRPSEN